MPEQDPNVKIVPKLGVTVLIIDDDPFLTGLYRLGLEKAGFDVKVATEGAVGIKMSKQTPPKLILLDLLMPMMDGFEVLEHLKKDRKLKAIPVVVLTTMSSQEDIDRAREGGAAAFMVKSRTLPFEAPRKIKEILQL